MTYSKAPWNRLPGLLENYPSTVDEVNSIVHLTPEEYPVLKTPKIIYPGDGWHLDKPFYVHKTHVTKEPENFDLALENISKTGRTLDSSQQT